MIFDDGDIEDKLIHYPYYDVFIYNGEVFTGEDIGNIHFGYVGSALFPPDFLHFGAGMYQILCGSRWSYWDTLFDEPKDYEMVSYGIELYGGKG